MPTKEERRAYMREWTAANRERVREYRRQTRDRRNARRRELYAAEEHRRTRQRGESRQWQQENPDKRLAQRLKPYGITVAEYREILARQHGRCGVCGGTNSGDKRTDRFHVDHCHASGRVRGLLCAQCNMGLGKFGDDPERLERAAMYLRAHFRTPRSS